MLGEAVAEGEPETLGVDDGLGDVDKLGVSVAEPL